MFNLSLQQLIENCKSNDTKAQGELYKLFSSKLFSICLKYSKNYAQADLVTYLPFDTPENARAFFKIVNPQLAILVKYEFWNHYISADTTQTGFALCSAAAP